MKDLREFELTVQTENNGVCPGPDGKNMDFLGRDASLSLVLTFTGEDPPEIRPGALEAWIDTLKFPFKEVLSANTYGTGVIELRSLDPGLYSGPTRIAVFYRDREGRHLLGKRGLLCIDTTCPAAPGHLRVTECGPGYFTLDWDAASGDIKEYRVQARRRGNWSTLCSGFRNPPVRVRAAPRGRVRVAAVDCALNRSFSREIILEDHCVVDLRVGFRAFRLDRATGRLTALREGDVLRNRDLLKLELVPNRRCWLYIINIDARDAVSVLFPHAGFARKNPVPASRRVLLPDRKHSFEVDTNGGAETIYVFASLQPDRDLESLIRKMGDERGRGAGRRFRAFTRGLGSVAEDPSFGPQGDFRDVIEKKAGESRAAKKYVFAHL